MEKLKSLLLPLALVFAAIAVFEVGARYGAANMRAYAITGELRLPLSIYVQSREATPPEALESIALMVDSGIATGATHRGLWYLNREARAQLDEVLAYAIAVRGDALIERYEQEPVDGSSLEGISASRLREIRKALRETKRELVDEAPSVAAEDAAPAP